MKKNNVLLLIIGLLIITGNFVLVMQIKLEGVLSFLNPFFYDNNLINLLFILIGLFVYNYFNSNPRMNYSDFIRNICIYVMPIYLLFVLVFSLVNNNFNLYYIIPHIFFINNWFPDLVNINNNTWIINIVFQFLIISYMLYMAISRKPKLTYCVCLLFSILSRIFLYHIAIPNSEYNDFMYFEIYGKQLLTTIDIFALGMLLGKYKNKILIVPKSKLLLFGNLIIIYICSYYSFSRYGIYDCKFGYVYSSIFSILLSSLIVLYYRIYKDMEVINIEKTAKFIGTLLLFGNIILYLLNDWFYFDNKLLLFIAYLLVSTMTSVIFVYVFDYIVSKSSSIFISLAHTFDKYKSLIFSIFTILILITCIPKLKLFFNRDIVSFNAIKDNNIIRDDKLEGIVAEIEKTVGEKEYSYLYVSEPEYQGFFNYYMMVYYLSMNKSIDLYHNYIATMYFGTDEDITKYICSMKPDYVIFHNYLLSSEKLIIDQINNENLYIYSVDSSHCTTLKDTLIPMNGGDLK